MKIMFMGTPDIAVPFLNALNSRHNVCCAVTQPDKPRGRGHKMTPCSVAAAAEKLGIDVVKPETFKDGAFEAILKGYQPELIAVVAYGRILPEYVLNYPEYGCINVHASLLPKYRGACPINKAIMEGDTVSGVTTMLMAKGMDTGDMLLRQEIAIAPDMTAGDLHDEICRVSPPLLLETVDNIQSLTPIKQDEAQATYTGMLTKENTRVDFCKSPEQTVNFIRGLNPFPAAHSSLGGRGVKLYRAAVAEGCGEPGTVLLSDGRLIVACGGGAVEIIELQLENKKRMTAAEALRGYKIDVGEVFS